MADKYVSELLRLSIAQICQTIGYHAIQTTPLELLQDNLHKFLHEFCRDLRRHVEHYNRIEANLDDVCLTLISLNVNINELLEYIFNVEPVPFAITIPNYPLYKESSLNFLKPGSKEVLIRPVHIYEHLPPILPPDNFANDSFLNVNRFVRQGLLNRPDDANLGPIELKSDINLAHIDDSTLKLEFDADLKDAKNERLPSFFKSKITSRILDEEGRPTREIGSVMMTTGGFISPAVEGKLPDSRIPDIIGALEGLDAPLPALPQITFAQMPTPSRAAAVIPPPSLSIISVAQQKIGSHEETNTASKVVLEQSVSLEELFAQTKQCGKITGGAVVDTSSSAIQVAANLRTPKKHGSVRQSALPPPLAARILKKAKKTSTMMPFSTSNKLNRSGLFNCSQDAGAQSADVFEKTQRKRMRMLQKLAKSAKTGPSVLKNSSEGLGKIKNLHGLFSTTLFDPSSSKRLQIEKALKRLAKHNQKLLRARMGLQLDGKIAKRFDQQEQHMLHRRQRLQVQQHDNQQQLQHLQADSMVDYPKVLSSKVTDSSKLFSNLIPTISQISDKKNTKSPNNAGLNPQCRKVRKTSPTAAQNILTLPDFCAINSLKTSKSPAFGEAPFFNDQTSKDVTKIKSPEIKLSTEPDRNKLNIFKKISAKQKMNRPLSPSPPIAGSTQIFSGNDKQVINLPSGTTITPAPPSSSQQVYAPNEGTLTVELSNKLNNVEDSRASLTKFSPSSSVFGKSLLREADSTDALYKPKKRGRKPGSKNQPKVPDQGHSSGESPKKSRKLKLIKNLYVLPCNFQTDNKTEPLNLSHSSVARADKSDIPQAVISTSQPLDQMETPERKKNKKNMIAPFENSREISPVGTQQNFREPPKKNIGLPSKEEVDSINRKLLKMDTVLQPAPPLQQVSRVHGLTPSLTKERSTSPTMNLMNSSPGPKQRSQLPKNAPGTLGPTGSPLENPIQNFMNFSNLPQNMLSMLPMYSFPPRPGLIPTQGLFPSVLGNYANKQINPAANMILQGFMPFPGIKPSNGGILRTPGIKISDKSDNDALVEPTRTDRNYCNVAPFVPESMKQKLSSPSSANCSLISPKQVGLTETPKTPQIKQSPTISENTRECIQQKLAGVSTPENRSVGSKSIPSTPGGISLNTFDSLIRGGDGINNIFSTPSNSIGLLDSSKGRALTHRSENTKNISKLPTLIVDSPIEVSDDSEEATALAIIPKTKNVSLPTNKQRITSKPNFLPKPLLSQIDDLFIPIDNARSIGSNPQQLLSSKNKEVKKIKKDKQNKISKITQSINHSASFDFCISKIGSDGGVGKLAGGADLIPLSLTGLAYSSKTTPNNCLTASTTASTTTFDIGNREFGSNDVFKEDLSVTPSSDMRDKRKKLKKIKYGKIKKKKDKKDKSKNKEKYAEKMEKRTKEKDPEKLRDKEVLKKLKKEKKREKHRFSKEQSTSSATSFSGPSDNLSSGCFDMNIMNLSSFSGSIPQVNATNTSSIPKLTLKLGSCQSPAPLDETKRKQVQKPLSAATTPTTTRESSPELARISPLVTRPPKQKPPIDSSNHLNAMGGVASTGSSNHGSFTSELFGEKNLNNSSIKHTKSSIPPAPSSWSTGGTLTASSTLLPQQLLQSSIPQHIHEDTSISASSAGAAPSTSLSSLNIHDSTILQETNRPSSYIDAEGNRVWICPACGKVDDGSAMIGCDGCDAWYHWLCVGIFVAPKANEDWFCRVCIAKKKGMHGIEKKRKRNKKNKMSQKAACTKNN